MKTIPVTIVYTKTSKQPVTCTHMLKVDPKARLYPEYLDTIIFDLECHKGILAKGWTMKHYEYNYQD